MGKVTIRDVANAASVGLSTVSRVINGNYPVNEKTRATVLKAIEQLDYVPNGVARSLKMKRTQLIGVIVPDVGNTFFMQLIKGIERRLSQNGYTLMIASSDECAEKEKSIVNIFLEKKAEALIVSTCQVEESYFQRQRRHDMPIVFVDRSIPGLDIDMVSEENELCAQQLTEFLIRNGHRRIGIVNSERNVDTSRRRNEGFRRAMAARKLPVHPEHVVEVRGYEGCYKAVRALFEGVPENQRPTALFATNNRRAEITLSVLNEMGIHVPDEVSLVAYGDVSASELLALKVTRIEQDTQRLGGMAADLAMKRIEKSGAPQSLSITSQLVVGNSHRAILE